MLLTKQLHWFSPSLDRGALCLLRLDFLMLAFTAVLGRTADLAPAILIDRISEGSNLVLASNQFSTNLPVAVSVQNGSDIVTYDYELEWQGKIVRQLRSTSPSGVVLTNLVPGKYFLTVTASSAAGVRAATDVSFNIQSAVLNPWNDSWSNAAIIDAPDHVITGSNLNATREATEPLLAGNAGGRSIWWSWQARSNSIVTVTTLGSSFDTLLGICTGTNLENLSWIGVNDDAGFGTNSFSQVTFRASGGVTYYFVVDSSVSPAGTVVGGDAQLRIVLAAPPAVALDAPADGLMVPLASTGILTNLNLAATISDPARINRVEYWLDGSSGISHRGVIPAPYQWNEEGLPPGNYVLSVMAANSDGLVGVAHSGFSLASTAGQVLLAEPPSSSPSGFPIVVAGLKGMNYALQSSTNLITWSLWMQWTNFAGVERVVDTTASQFKQRFYRVTLP